MHRPKPLLKSAALFIWNKLTWAGVIVFVLFMICYPIYESYHENQMLKQCQVEHNVPKCKITTVAVPA